MTNEEAIIYLREAHNNLFQHIPYNDNYHNAIDLAIRALETGEVYMTGEDYNLYYIEGYKDGKRDFEQKQGDIHDFIAKADEGTLFQLKKEIENALTKIVEREAYEEARREAMRLDDNEDTLKWKGTH